MATPKQSKADTPQERLDGARGAVAGAEARLVELRGAHENAVAIHGAKVEALALTGKGDIDREGLRQASRAVDDGVALVEDLRAVVRIVEGEVVEADQAAALGELAALNSQAAAARDEFETSWNRAVGALGEVLELRRQHERIAHGRLGWPGTALPATHGFSVDCGSSRGIDVWLRKPELKALEPGAFVARKPSEEE